MNRELSIDTEEEFRVCLRQAFAAKNALSRVGGFTPEQALLGKSRHLPGSLTGDDDVSSHSLAVSDDPEGQWFLRTLARREQARRSFIAARHFDMDTYTYTLTLGKRAV